MGSGWSSLINCDKLNYNDPKIIEKIKRYIEKDEDMFIDSVGRDYILGDNNSRKRRTVRRDPDKDWWSTAWGLIILDPKIRDIETKDGQTFRRRFRVPGHLFLDFLVPECKKVNTFDNKINRFGDLITQIPVEIKILMSLRVLARGNVMNGISEFTSAGPTTVTDTFKTFVVNFYFYFKDAFIYMSEGQNLANVLKVYNRFRWLACPKELTNLCTGKEHF